MKTINLERILIKTIFKDMKDISVSYTNKGKQEILAAMKEACRQTLKLAAENAKWKLVKDEEVDLFGYDFKTEVDKQSILDVIDKIK